MSNQSANPIMPLALAGRCASAAQADAGLIVHAVVVDGVDSQGQVFKSSRGLCGAKPGLRSLGWDALANSEVTCPRCLKRSVTIGKRHE